MRYLLILFLLFMGCGSEESSCDPKSKVLYDGPPYGGLVTVIDKVNTCMGITGTIPRVVIYETDFYSYAKNTKTGETGCIFVHGSAGKGTTVSLAKPSLEDSKGQLFAEEYMHFLGIEDHEHKCMKLTW